MSIRVYCKSVLNCDVCLIILQDKWTIKKIEFSLHTTEQQSTSVHEELIMKNLNMFLESSTLHGLNHISNSRKCGKLFWIWIVFSGFLIAGVLIYQSFLNWRESPIKTTIQTLPIKLIKFPKVTVCPPKESFFIDAFNKPRKIYIGRTTCQ